MNVVFTKAQSNINIVLGKYVGTINRNGCPNSASDSGVLYIVPDPNYQVTVYAYDSSSFGQLGEPWSILVNSDSSMIRYPGSTMSDSTAALGKLYSNDSVHLSVFKFGSVSCFRTFDGFKLYSTVGIQDLNKQENKLLISPQPANDFVYIQSTQLTFSQEEIPIIYDIGGKQIKLQTHYINANTYKLDVSSLSAGMYVINLKTENGVVRKKMIVEK